MNGYGKAALEAVRLYVDTEIDSPAAAWHQAATKLLGEGMPFWDNDYARDAFLGLCEEGLVKGIPPGEYCHSIWPKTHALSALRYIYVRPELSKRPSELWLLVSEDHQADNGQMDVVLALWNFGLIEPRAV